MDEGGKRSVGEVRGMGRRRSKHRNNKRAGEKAEMRFRADDKSDAAGPVRRPSTPPLLLSTGCVDGLACVCLTCVTAEAAAAVKRARSLLNGIGRGRGRGPGRRVVGGACWSTKATCVCAAADLCCVVNGKYQEREFRTNNRSLSHFANHIGILPAARASLLCDELR